MLRISSAVFWDFLPLNQRLIALRENCIIENLSAANTRGSQDVNGTESGCLKGRGRNGGE